MIKNTRMLRVLLAGSALTLSQFSYAAAFQLYELAAPINGTAAVGQAVVTDDASIAYYNPAGMAFVDNSQFLVGTQMILPYTNFSKKPATTIDGTNGGNAATLVPGGDGYIIYNYSPKVKFGLAFTAPYGGSLDYDNHWVGRYYVQQMTFYTLNLNPSVAYKINDKLAVAGGIALEYANLYQTVAIPSPLPLDGQLTVRVNNFSPGVNLGAYFTPTPQTKMGIAWRSQIIHRLRGSSTFFNLSANPSTSTTMVMPANLIASISQQVTDKTTLLGELGWSDWSSMSNGTVTIRDISMVTPQNWNNTYRAGVGARYQYSPMFLWQAGLSYDSSPTSASKRTPNLPMDRQVRVGVGLVVNIIKNVKLGASYEYINFGDANINNVAPTGNLVGSYSRNYANAVQASVNVEL